MAEHLTDLAIRNAKPKDKTYKLTDGNGLFLLVTPTGGKWWRYKYCFERKEKLLSFGIYPETTLAEAREKKREARKAVKAGIDPAAVRKAAKASQNGEENFENIAREWHGKFSPTWAKSHSEKIIGRFVNHVFPWIGAKPVKEITPPELLAVMRRIESGGSLDTAHRALQNCGQVFRYAVATGRAERDPSADLRGALPPVCKKHFAAITNPAKIGLLLKAISEYKGLFTTKAALKLAPLVFLRPGHELRLAEWSEINFDRAEWRLPIERMKRRQTIKDARRGEVGHIVPLAKQAIEILKELHQATGNKRFIFTGRLWKDRPISEGTLTKALREMGYPGDEMQMHGFRHMASTLMHELGFPSQIIEKQIDHGDKNRIRAVYNHAEYLPERRKIMQEWADYLDRLAAGEENKIVPIRSAG